MQEDDHVHQRYLHAVEEAYNSHIMENNDPQDSVALTTPRSPGRAPSMPTPNISDEESNHERVMGVVPDIDIQTASDPTTFIQPDSVDSQDRVEIDANCWEPYFGDESWTFGDTTAPSAFPELPEEVLIRSYETGPHLESTETIEQLLTDTQQETLADPGLETTDQLFEEFLDPGSSPCSELD